MKSAFDKIADGLEDAIAYAKGDECRGRTATVNVKAVREARRADSDRVRQDLSLPDRHRARLGAGPEKPRRRISRAAENDPG